MEKGDKVYTAYVSDSFNNNVGFSAWVDEYTVLNPDVGEGLILLKGPYGSTVVRTPDEIYDSKLAAQEAVVAGLKRRVDSVIRQMEKITAEANAAPVIV